MHGSTRRREETGTSRANTSRTDQAPPADPTAEVDGATSAPFGRNGSPSPVRWGRSACASRDGVSLQRSAFRIGEQQCCRRVDGGEPYGEKVHVAVESREVAVKTCDEALGRVPGQLGGVVVRQPLVELKQLRRRLQRRDERQVRVVEEDLVVELGAVGRLRPGLAGEALAESGLEDPDRRALVERADGAAVDAVERVQRLVR